MCVLINSLTIMSQLFILFDMEVVATMNVPLKIEKKKKTVEPSTFSLPGFFLSNSCETYLWDLSNTSHKTGINLDFEQHVQQWKNLSHLQSFFSPEKIEEIKNERCNLKFYGKKNTIQIPFDSLTVGYTHKDCIPMSEIEVSTKHRRGRNTQSMVADIHPYVEDHGHCVNVTHDNYQGVLYSFGSISFRRLPNMKFPRKLYFLSPEHCKEWLHRNYHRYFEKDTSSECDDVDN
jgi:hypothetical protein